MKLEKNIYKNPFFLSFKNPNKNPEIKKIKPCIKDPAIGSSLKKLIILEPYWLKNTINFFSAPTKNIRS